MNPGASNRDIILASSSLYRQRLMQQLGVDFRSISPEVDETLLQQNTSLSATEIAEGLARQKAESLALTHPDSIVIGSDQVIELEGKLIGKPGSREANISQLKQLRGKTHRLMTAACVLEGRTCYIFTNLSELTVRALTSEEIMRYVDRDQAYDCAGGYRWEAFGIALFEKVKTEDHTAILGLPLIRLVTVLRSLGVSIP